MVERLDTGAQAGSGDGFGGAPQQVGDPEEATNWERVRPRHIDPSTWDRFTGHVTEIFGAFGMDLDTPGTRDTPERFLRAMYDATAGYEGDPKLLTAFPAEGVGGHVIEGPISFSALCEHHALPVFGVAHVGYVAGEQIIGI